MLIFTGRITKAPILWPPDVKSRLIRKDYEAGKDWRQEETGTTEDGGDWMASPTQWTWIWVNSGSWWRTGRPGVLQPMWPQRVGHDWETEHQQQQRKWQYWNPNAVLTPCVKVPVTSRHCAKGAPNSAPVQLQPLVKYDLTSPSILI